MATNNKAADNNGDNPRSARNVILLANDFPPIGGAGTQRPFYFSKYLPGTGWIPHVVTVKDVVFPVHDESLLGQLPKEVEIHRTESLELRRLLWWLRKLKGAVSAKGEAAPKKPGQSDVRALNPRLREFGRAFRKWFFVPDDRIFWAPFAILKTLVTVREHSVDLIMATVPTYSTGVIGYLASLISGIPLVVDMRDPWTDDPYSQSPTLLHRRLNCFLEKITLRRTSRIIVISKEMETRFTRKYPFVAAKIAVITNGYDAGEFKDVKTLDDGGKFVVGYVGSLYAHHLDSVQVFCKAWSDLAAENPQFKDNSVFWIVGRCDPEIVEEFSRWPNMTVEMFGYQPHHESIRFLKSSSCLLLLIKNLDPTANLVTIPGKLFEYVGSGRPIIMVGPSGDAADIVLTGRGAVHREDDVAGIGGSLNRLYLEHVGAPSATVDTEFASKFDRKSLTERLVMQFKYVIPH